MYAQVMTADAGFVTVFQAAHHNAEQDATAVKNLLIQRGFNGEVIDSGSSDLPAGTFAVRVPAPESDEAQRLIAEARPEESWRVDTSHELDMVAVAVTHGSSGEMQALAIQAVLDANGINSVLVGASTLPNLSFQVRVAAADLSKAQAAIAEAEAAGGAAADEAARNSEPVE
jgi:phosphomannomutase